jgi:hypothetical protein
MKPNEQTAELRLEIEAWQKAWLEQLADEVGSTAADVTRTCLLRVLTAEKPPLEWARTCEQVGRNAMALLGGSVTDEEYLEDFEALPLVLSAGTASYLRALAVDTTGGNVGRLVELIVNRCDPDALRKDVDEKLFTGKLVSA